MLIPKRADHYALGSQIGLRVPSCTFQASSYLHPANLSPSPIRHTTSAGNVIYLNIKDKVGNRRSDESGEICWDGTCRFYTSNLRLSTPIFGP